MKRTKKYLGQSKRYPSKIRLLLGSMGPGVISGAADDDPSGIGTYTIAGAQFGTKFLWSALLTWPLMAAVQMACARIGMVTGEGLASALKKKLPAPVLAVFCLSLFLANTLNVGADLSAMADSAEMLVGGSSHLYVFLFALIISWATIKLRYFHIARVLKWLALFLLSYVIVAFIIGPDWKEALKDTLIPHWPSGNEEWGTLVAILGTTISPYLFFWQASQEVEEEKESGRNTLEKRYGATMSEIRIRKLDVGIGTFFSNIVMYFIILSTALTLHRHGLTHIGTSKQAAEALTPIAGRFASLLYTIGLLGVGFLAIPTLTGSAAYALAETFDWHQGLDSEWLKARSFYTVIIVSTAFAVVFDFAGVNPIRALYWSAVVNGILAPFLLAGILLVICDSTLMRGQRGSLLGRLVVGITMVLMFGAAVGMLVFS